MSALVRRTPMPAHGRGWRCVVTAACLALALGCNSLKLTPLTADKPAKVEKEPLPPAPCKNSFRVSQYVFYFDFDLKRDQPIFQELADLRDQVYQELQLPSANTLVQVYLFES